ncbi:hypothetical protein BT63DRAFT_400571 [Microthyrium microscopicum]|uniref:Pyruvate carboxylase n=1 Tax=Microthyrium microscopicum TaxID=703497 RepID=A0A6A6UDJ3_9PEZI|nr:hypothetical protein BT63DRAFT_400571 [Microthyrium microscopicum]
MSLNGRPLTRPISRLLVANRGEIAARIISAAAELSLPTIALYSRGDTAHTHGASEAVELPSPEAYLDIDALVNIIKQHKVDAVHPGYGFLSESAEFSRRVWEEAGAVVIGPGWELLNRTGDKLAARKLAEECSVPVLAALGEPTADVAALRRFAADVEYPVMIKAVDGGGGRGIRLVRSESELEGMAKRAIEESVSKSVFAEKAAVDGCLHVEVQIVGDGTDVIHLFERQCSIQRRYQKVVEIAPCVGADCAFIAKIIQAAITMAKKVQYFSLGTFEFLANPTTQEFFFLEINPRLQVEHTISESICRIDLVRAQLLISQGASLSASGLPLDTVSLNFEPSDYSVQFRITAEDVRKNWSLSVGKITALKLPGGNGIRVDAALEVGQAIGSSFDSLLAKIIVTGPTWPIVVAKARRALNEARIEGIQTNLEILRGIAAHPDFSAGDCDTTWLETRQAELLELGATITQNLAMPIESREESSSTSATSAITAGAPIFRKGDSFTANLIPLNRSQASSSTNHLQLTRILRNDFPTALTAEVTFASSSSSAPQKYKLELSSTTASASAVTCQHRRGDPNNPRHIVIPFPGKLVEVCVDEGDMVKVDDVVCVVRQMKMEVEIRAKRGGRVKWITEVEDGEEVVEGILAAEIEVEGPRL